MKKEWLFLCFYPQEDARLLETYRNKLTKFQKSALKALTFELENDGPDTDDLIQEKEDLCDEIIHEASLLSNTAVISLTQNYSVQNTLGMENRKLALNRK